MSINKSYSIYALGRGKEGKDFTIALERTQMAQIRRSLKDDTREPFFRLLRENKKRTGKCFDVEMEIKAILDRKFWKEANS